MTVERCIVCAQSTIISVTAGRFVHVVCRACGAEFEVEFDPADDRQLRGRITMINFGVPPDDNAE